MGDSYSEAFVWIVEWSRSLGAKSIRDLPGCWERAIDDRWWVAVNGHNTPIRCSDQGGKACAAEVPPFTAYVTYNGWPAAFIDPRGGICAAGPYANEDALIAAIKAVMSPEAVREVEEMRDA